MKNIIRYIDLKNVSPEVFSTMWEVDFIIDIQVPTIFQYTSDRVLCHLWEPPRVYTNISSLLLSKELLDVYMMRCYAPVDIFLRDPNDNTAYVSNFGYYIETPDVTNWIILHPDNNIHRKMDSISHSILQDIFKEKNIKTKHVKNDLFLRDPVDKKLKKFVGSLYRPAKNNHSYSDMALTWKFDVDVANRVRKVADDENIKLKKFEVDDIGERAVGLSEIYPTLNREEIELEFVNRFSNFFDLTVKKDTLLKNEEEKLFNRGKIRLEDKEWQYKGIDDNFGDSSYE
jgi:lipoate-protein ligase A